MSNKVLNIRDLQILCRKILSSSLESEIELSLSHLLGYYDIYSFSFEYERPIFRARKCKNKNGFINTKDMLAPPDNLATSGRLNEARSSVLYSSLHVFTALSEIGAKEGDYVQIVGLSFKDHIRLGVLGEFVSVHRTGNTWFPGDSAKGFNDILSSIDDKIAQSIIFTDAFVSEILNDKEASKDNYVHSKILSKLLFKKQSNMDGIAYPSVVITNAINFAINPNVVGSKLQIGSTFVVKIKEVYDYGLFNYEIVRAASGCFLDGTITWQN